MCIGGRFWYAWRSREQIFARLVCCTVWWVRLVLLVVRGALTHRCLEMKEPTVGDNTVARIRPISEMRGVTYPCRPVGAPALMALILFVETFTVRTCTVSGVQTAHGLLQQSQFASKRRNVFSGLGALGKEAPVREKMPWCGWARKEELPGCLLTCSAEYP